MTQAPSKLVLSASRDIPFNKLVLSQANVRRTKAGVSIEELAADIARRTLLQSLTVRAVLAADGAETGEFEVPAGGRRYRALELLVKQKRLARTAPIPCVVRTEGLAEEDSLAENVQRAPLHPLDQFRAFLTLREKGMGEEEIAATFFVSPQVVRQRLKLASVSPRLLEIYAEDGMTLDQLMAFTISTDHARQEQIWEGLQRAYNKESYQIRRMLTEGAVRAADKRAQFVGIEAYGQAGGIVMRDLFQPDDGGWLQDPVLLERLVAQKLEREAEVVRAEGWRWMEVALDFPYGHTYGLRRLVGETPALTAEEETTRQALQAEYEQIEATYAEAEELPETAEQRLTEIEAALADFADRPVSYQPEDRARAGAFVSVDGSGALRIERGFVRPEDEVPVTPVKQPDREPEAEAASLPTRTPVDPSMTSEPETTTAEPEEDDGLKPLPDRLLTELTAHRTLALRHALGDAPDTALLAALHALCLKLFYRYGGDSCLEIDAKSIVFGNQAPGLNDTALAKTVDDRHRAWSAQLPRDTDDLWDTLCGFDETGRRALFAHCVGLTVNAMHEAWNRRPRALAHADRIAQAVGLDMVAAGWTPTVDNYLGRLTKARILQAVREACGEQQAQLIDHLKKGEMAERAQELLTGTGWLPEPLRTAGQVHRSVNPEPSSVVASTDTGAGEDSVINGGGSAIDPPHAEQENGATSDLASRFAAE
jgi:ParB family chromosome partitioning protein